MGDARSRRCRARIAPDLLVRVFHVFPMTQHVEVVALLVPGLEVRGTSNNT